MIFLVLSHDFLKTFLELSPDFFQDFLGLSQDYKWIFKLNFKGSALIALIVKRPGVAGAALQTALSLFP